MKLFNNAARAAVIAAPVVALGVPKYLRVTETMRSAQSQLAQSSLIPLDFTVGVQEMPQVTGADVFSKHSGDSGSVAFVVRRPG